MIFRKIGVIQAGKCFLNKDGDINDFFRDYLEKAGKSEGESKCLWKISESDGVVTVQRVVLGNNFFLVPTTMLDRIPNGYLIQENVLLVRLKLGWETIPLFFPSAEAYDLLRNDKVLELVNSRKRLKCFGAYFDEKERRLYYINEVLLTLDELMYDWEGWEEILRGYPSLVSISSTLGLSTLSLIKNNFSISIIDEKPKLTSLAEAVKEICIPRK